MFEHRAPWSGESASARLPADLESATGPVATGVFGSGLAELVRLATRLTTEVDGCEDWSAIHRGQALRVLDHVAGALATVRAAVLVAERAARTSLRPGDRDFESARARQSRTGFGEACREVRQADTLVALPLLADGVRAGRIPLAHVDALARITASAGAGATAALATPELQTELASLAERHPVTVFASAAARLLAASDPHEVERGIAAQRRARYLHLSRQPDGTYLRGRLDNLSGEVLRVAMASVRQAPDADRDRGRADADALVALAERAISGMAGIRPRRAEANGLPTPDPEQDAADARVSGVANRPTLSLLVPAETFAELDAARRRCQESSTEKATDAGVDLDARVAPPATLDDGSPVALSQLARMLCDSEIGRMVMSAEGLPLDVGRTQRLYSGAQRRAVIVRDRQCSWNGCEVPAAHCEVHHIRWWDRHGGGTSVENGLLVCSHHHHVIHELSLDVRRLASDPFGGPAGSRAGPAPDRRGPISGSPVVRYSFHRSGGAVVNAPQRVPTTRPKGSPGVDQTSEEEADGRAPVAAAGPRSQVTGVLFPVA